MRIFYTDQFVLPLPDGHRFPMRKYSRLRERVAAADWLVAGQLIVPHSATDDELARAHDVAYIERVQAGGLSELEVKRIGFLWSPAMVERSRRSSGATIEACRSALDSGYGVNLA